ncbi:PREDICTED: cysteine-rich receptor-like protein kinase 29 [Erythranthe guttata]|nr:PREDICTED: cysteine-rich receptor-like protein kinase 29 [Erythranthe guttata]|eukprot:XP_012841177.1 PREDICTED: cysteine-rich receptor-like protein kinase 29 [Erythranthe guttata]
MALSQFDQFICSTNGNYTTESLYRADLNGVLRSLSSNMNSSGFYSASVGRANVAALCRADVQLNQCQGCVNIVSQTILVNCPNQFGAIMWSEFCMVRYSNKNLFGTLAILPYRILYSGANSTSPVGFKAAREKLIEDVRAQAAGSGTLRKAAVGNTTGPDGQGIFTLLQCTPDLSPENCISCLVKAARYIPRFIDHSTGIRVYTPSCIYRYENQLFYNITRLQEPLVPALMPPSVPPSRVGDQQVNL